MKLSFQADRDPLANSIMFSSAQDFLVKESVKNRTIIDEDLAQVPEVMPFFFKLAGTLRDDMYSDLEDPIKSELTINCFYYCFGKGAESAYLWNQSANGRINFNYDPDIAIYQKMELATNINAEFANYVSLGMEKMKNVFLDFQNCILIPVHVEGDDEFTADLLACGLYWSTAIGLDYGMDKLGYK